MAKHNNSSKPSTSIKGNRNRRGGSRNTNKPNIDEYASSKCAGNDFSWYNKNPKLLSSAGSLIFSKRYGDHYNSLSFTGTEHTMQDTGNRSVAGVVRAVFDPFISAKGNDADPINIAAKNLYTWLRHKNSGARVFEQSDLIQVLLSTGSIKSGIEYLKKLLRCVASYSAVNRFAMRYIIPFNDVEFSNMVANLANYTTRLNLLVAKATCLIIPKDIPIFSRWKWLSANVFRDDELNKCSYYTFQPRIIWHYDWENQKCTQTPFNKNSFVDMVDLLEKEIDNLVAYEDYGTMSGDILKAYGEGNIDVTTGMDLGEIQDPTLDKDAIKQFKNMIVTGVPQANYTLEQANTNSQLLKTVCADAGAQLVAPGKFVYNTEHGEDAYEAGFTYLPKLVVSSDQPSVEECVEQTRFSYVIESVTVSGTTRLVLDEVGTEVITDLRAYFFDETAGGAFLKNTGCLQTMTFSDIEESSDLFDYFKDRAISTGLTGDPQYIFITKDEDNNINCFQYFEGDNITVLDKQYLSTLHKACVLSEWTMPMFNLLEVK